MPIYEYVCKTCGEEFDRFVRLAEFETRPECPTCSSRDTQKRLSTFASQSGGESASAAGSGCRSSSA